MSDDFDKGLLGLKGRNRVVIRNYDDEPRPDSEYNSWPTPESLNLKRDKPVTFWKKAFSFLVLVALLIGLWVAGQISLGVPDELVAQIFTVLIYNWFTNNGYKLPRWLKK